ncbi:OmpL47-type beta-barrel domain-containing protein [Sutcliffiella sp. NC1]|uniref:OmpL47-type beta-barrel domain-containing protein n=1 Tax=Sutcliffiella sp. NC1 TaxID=3004096 RepID=UPI0022DE2086|nr:Ig-like domain repeat protein [Sutcliffiella sp. NC1]WBL14497.1 Ig-like domain repeat protein [Sutcliffiella sp. NC1]
MKKSFFRKFTLLALFLMVAQSLLPVVDAFANSDNNMLPPSNIDAEYITPDDVKLVWNSVHGATGYHVYEITEGQLILLGETTAANFTLNDLEEGSYRYVISTLNGDWESGPSAPVSVDVTYPTMESPSTITHKVENGNDIVLNWEASPYAESYHVFEISSEGDASLIATEAGTTYKVNNAPEGLYTYAVSASHSLYGESSLSHIVEVEVTYPLMTAPQNFTYSLVNGSDVSLKWDAIPFVKNYHVYEILDDERVLKSTVTDNKVTFTNQSPGEYVYEVRSNNDRFGESEKGSLLNVNVSEITMSAPANFTYKIQNYNDIVLSWGTVPYATSYKIYQVNDEGKSLVSTVTGTSVTYPVMPAGDYVYEVHSFSDRFGESVDGSVVTFSVEKVDMDAPNNFSYKINNGNDIALSWDTTPNTNNYKIYQIVDGEKVLVSTRTNTNVTFTNMPEENYEYVVHSFSTRFGESEEGSQLSFTLEHPVVKPPENLIQSINNPTSFTLNWDAALFTTNYRVYEVVGGEKILKSTTSRTNVTYSNVLPGEYTYVVHTYSSRFGESLEGSVLKVTMNGETMATPTNLSHSVSNGNDIRLTWSSVQYAQRYNIYEIIDGERVLKNSITGTALSFINLPEGNYHYVVHSASTLLGESPEGAEVKISIVHPTMEAPNTVTSRVQNGNDVVLSWESAPFANNYRIYEVVGEEKELRRTVNSLSTILSNEVEGERTYVVHSFNNRFGESAEGIEVTQEVVFPEMQKPENVTYSINNGNDVVLRWNAAEYATNYVVYQFIDGELALERTVSGAATTFSNMPEGEHKYIVHSNSTRFGESGEGSEVSLTLIHPTMQAPENVTYSINNGNDIVLRWNASSFATNYKVYRVVNEELVLERTVSGTVTSFSNMPEGEYDYVVHSNSTRFGESHEGETISFTLIHPTMQPPGNLTNSISNGNDIVLKWSASTFANNYKVYRVIGEELVLERTVSGTSVTFTNMPEGNYEYIVHSYSNRFDESPEGSTLDFTLVWPTVQSPQVTGTVVNANNVTLSWPTATWANEYRVYKVNNESRELIYKGTARNYTVHNLTEETHSFEVTSFNTRFGESKPSNRITETIIYPIMEPPVANLVLLSDTSARILWDFVTYANGYNIYELIDGEAVLIAERVNNLSYTVRDLSYRNHEYVVTSYSNSFGESARSNIVLAKLIIDTVPPVTTINASENWTNESVAITLSATDEDTGVANTYYSINDSAFVEGNSFVIEGEGIHAISFYSVDKVGNKEEVQTIEVKIDQTAPVTASNISSGKWLNEAYTVEFTAEDSKSGVGNTYYSINESAFTEGTSFTISKEGVHEVSYYSVDNAGNIEEVKTEQVKLDFTAPVTISNIVDGWLTEAFTVQLTATDGKSGVATTYYSLNGSDFVEGTSFTIEDEGVHEVSYYSVDVVGNKEEVKTEQVKIDGTVPVTSSNILDKWLNEPFTVQLITGESTSEIAATNYSINGSDFVEGTSFTIEEEGVHEVSYYSVDNAGNVEEVKTEQVKLDFTVPETTSNIVNGWLTKAFTVQLTATDSLSGVSTTYVSVDESEHVESTNITFEEEGLYEVSYYSVDQAGNVEAAKTEYVKIDKTAPAVSWDYEDEYALGTELTLTYDAFDALSGIQSETLLFNGKQYNNGDVVVLEQPGKYTLKLEVVDNAGNVTTLETEFVVYIPLVDFEVLPKVITPNTGVFTVKVNLVDNYSTKGFDLNTVTINGVNAINKSNGSQKQAENGQFKFNRDEFVWNQYEQVLEFRGYVDGQLVVGYTTVKVQSNSGNNNGKNMKF